MPGPTPSRWTRASEAIGLAGAGLVALGLGVGGAPIRVGTGLVLIACLMDAPRLWFAARREPLFWVALALTAYLCFLVAWRVLPWQDDFNELLRGLSDAWVHTGGLALLFGWVLAGRRRFALAILGLAGLGLAYAWLRHGAPAEVRLYLSGARADYHLGGNGPGLYFGSVLLALYSLGFAALARLSPDRPVHRSLWLGLFCLAVVAATLPVLFNQSRAAWVALVGVLPLTVWLQWRHPPAPLTAYPRHAVLTVGLALVLMLGTVFGVREVIAQRIQVEEAVVAQVVQGQAVDATTSVGTRITLWQLAHQAIQARPLLGHGPGGAEALIRAEPELAQYPHFHDLYLQIAVESGLLGLAASVAVYALLAGALRRAWREGRVDADLALFVASAWALYFIYSVFEIRHDDIRGFAYVALLMGLAYAPWLNRHRVAG